MTPLQFQIDAVLNVTGSIKTHRCLSTQVSYLDCCEVWMFFLSKVYEYQVRLKDQTLSQVFCPQSHLTYKSGLDLDLLLPALTISMKTTPIEHYGGIQSMQYHKYSSRVT